MTDGQEPDNLRTGAILLAGVGSVIVTLALVGVAWLFVVRAPEAGRTPSQPSMLEHGLFEEASGGADANARGAHNLDRYRWVDRSAQLVQIPIEHAIDAVVADPSLIGGHR